MGIRVLHVLNNLGSGGAEAFIMNMYRAIDRNKVQFDFLIRSNQNGHYVDEIKEMGGKVYILPPFPQHIFQNYKLLKSFLCEHTEYQTIHVHANSLIYIKPLQYAMRQQIPQRIIHSHSSKSKSLLSRVVHTFNRKRIDKYVTKRLACSAEAGRWMHGSRKYEIINNGIDLRRFCYNENIREIIRKRYHIEEAFVIGHVGRFVAIKNHKFLLDVFQQYFQTHPTAVLMLVGDGKDLDDIKVYADQLHVSHRVIFCGAVENVEDYLSAMDVFVFPSIYEGLGIVLIEAQANGLPCVISDTISKAAIINNNCVVHSLNDPIQFWVQGICEAKRISKISERIKEYDSRISAKQLEMIYLNEK